MHRMSFSVVVIFKETITSIKEEAKFYFFLVLMFLLGNSLLFGIMYMFEELNIFLVIAYRLIDLALYVKLAVTVHRVVLLNEAWNWRRLFNWRNCETEFFIISLMFGFFMIIATLIVNFIINIFLEGWISGLSDSGQQFFWLFIISYIFIGVSAYICLIFPNLAVGGRFSLDQCIQLTQEVFGKVFVLISLVPTIGLLVYFIIEYSNKEWVTYLTLPLSGFILIFDVALLSHIYRRLVSNDTFQTEQT